MTRILVTAGGTATAWHIANIAREYFPDTVELHVCDINEPYLVPAASICCKGHTVPLATDDAFSDRIRQIIKSEKIDCVIPLIPLENQILAQDGVLITELGIKSTAAKLKTTHQLADKAGLYRTLCNLGIPTPRVFFANEISENDIYIMKPKSGFGSRGIQIATGVQILSNKAVLNDADAVIQEYCHGSDYDEVTVEVYNGLAGLRIFARKRTATRMGVCVKAEPVDITVFFPAIQKLVQSVECPAAFNVQFLRYNGQWLLFDCNLRLGAGTALSTAIGFQLTRAMLAEIVGDTVEPEWFKIDPTVKSVLRVYQEIVVR